VLFPPSQAGVATGPLTALALLLLGAVAVTLAVAFGLGSREVARSLSSGRYVRADFEVGQTIRIDDLRGTIVRMDGAATTLRSGQDTVRVPNHLLVERVVVVEAESM
jgi:small-conductance mechanosensitive channel